jgi:hypothetical protein
MKKILSLLLLVLCAKVNWAQDAGGENELKNFRFGLRATPSLNWYKPDDKKKFESAGIRPKFGYGLITEFRLSKVVSLATGVGFDYDGGKLKMLIDTNAVYYVKDNEFIETEDPGKTYEDTSGTVGIFYLSERSYNTNYITIPLTLKMKTKEIGMLTYYGMFGINASFRVKSRVDDKYRVIYAPARSTYDGSDMENTNDMNLFKFALNIGGGAEYNLSGSTSVVFGLNYFGGFSNVLKKESRYLQDATQTTNKPLIQKATGNAIALTVGILF